MDARHRSAYFIRSAALYVLGFAAVVDEESVPSAERGIERRQMKTANHYHYLYRTAKRQFGEGRPVSRLGYLPKATLRTVWTQKSTPDSKPPPYQRADNGVKGNLQEAFQKDRKGKGRVLALAIIMAILLLAWEAPVLPEFSSKKKHP